MRHVLRLALRYLGYYRGRTLILTACIALTLLFPLGVNWLVASYEESIGARAAATPLVLGARGSRFDLVLSTLYYRGKVPSPLPVAAADRCRDTGFALAIPIHARHGAAGFPIVGTTPDYYDFRDLEPAAGSLPLVMGECVLGSAVAAATGLGPGDKLLSESETVYDLTKGYPLRMQVAGVLRESGTPDDRAVFVDLKTAWILDGIGHGHGDAARQGAEQVLRRTGDGVVLNASVRKWNEITPENAHTFHFHLPRAERPLTGIVVVPHSRKAATLIKGRYRLSETAQLLVPTEVVDEIFAFVLELKAFFDANVLVVIVAALLFVTLVVLLSLRVREREIQTLHRLGCARAMVWKIMATELALVALTGLVIASALAAVFVTVAQRVLAL